MNACDEVRESLLTFDWSAKDRRRAQEVLQHLESCPPCAAAAVDFERLRTRIAGEVRPFSLEQWNAIESRLSATIPRRNFRRQWALAAAVLLAAAIGFGIGRRGDPEAESLRRILPTAEAVAVFSPSEVARQAEVFSQISSVFDHRTAWIVNSDQDADMGVATNISTAPRQLLLVRLAIEQAGKPASVADLAIIPGATAKLCIPVAGGNIVAYEIGASAHLPTMLSFGAQLQSHDSGQTLGAIATSLPMQPGQQITAGQIHTSAGDYQLSVAFAQTDLSAPASSGGQ